MDVHTCMPSKGALIMFLTHSKFQLWHPSNLIDVRVKGLLTKRRYHYYTELFTWSETGMVLHPAYMFILVNIDIVGFEV